MYPFFKEVLLEHCISAKEVTRHDIFSNSDKVFH